MPVAEGQKAPAFALKDTAGKTVELAHFAGRNLILYFYPRDATPGCTKEACGFRDAWAELEERGVAVVGVSPDDMASHQKFAKKHRIPFPLLSDPDKETMRAYGAWGKKTLYGKKTTGVIRSTVWIGPDGKVKKHWAKIPSAEKHPARVLAALAEAGQL